MLLPSPARTLALLGAIALVAGCHESDIEPRSAIEDDWAIRQWQQPAGQMSQADIPRVWAENPAPMPRIRARSVSLGFVGDAPLEQESPAEGRWPWAQELFPPDCNVLEPQYGFGRRFDRGHW